MEITVIRVIVGYATGILVSFVLGSIAGTQVVLASVQAMGLEVSWAARIQVSRTDLLGLSATLLPIMALALAAGWGLYDGVISRVSLDRVTHAYALVGAGCILALHPLLALILGVDVFAATRSLGGLLAQGIAGAVGGWCCGYVRSRSST
jgi:hypothetical protein